MTDLRSLINCYRILQNDNREHTHTVFSTIPRIKLSVPQMKVGEFYKSYLEYVLHDETASSTKGLNSITEK